MCENEIIKVSIVDEFLSQHKEVYGDDKCCPDRIDLKCKTNTSSCPFTSPTACEPGYELETIRAADSDDMRVRTAVNCPMVDECCPVRVCVCKSCVYEGGRMDLGASPVTSSDG